MSNKDLGSFYVEKPKEGPKDRRKVVYWDAEGNAAVRYFASDVPDEEIPETVFNTASGLIAGRDPKNPPEEGKQEPFKTHLAYVKERRSEACAEKTLQEALNKLRERRGGRPIPPKNKD